MKLKVKVPLLIGTTVLACTVAVIIAMNSAVSEALEKSTYNSIKSEVGANEAFIKAQLESQQIQLWELANRARTRSMNWEAVQSSLLPEVSRVGVLDFGLVLPDGSTRYVTDNSRSNLGDRDYIKQAFSGKNSISDIIISRVTNKPVLMFAAPILASNEAGAPILGVLAARKEGEKALSEVVERIVTSHKGGYTFMINNEGTYVAHANHDWVNKQLNPIKLSENDASFKSMGDAFAKALNEETGIVSYYYEGKEFVSSFKKMKDSPWMLFLAIEKSKLEEEVAEVRAVIILVGSVCLIFGILAAIFLGNSIVKPIRRIVFAIDNIAQGDGGDFTKQIEINSNDELSDMAHSVNKLTKALQGSISETKSIVQSLASAAKELSSVSRQLSASADETVSQVTNVTEKTGQVSTNINAMASGAEEASVNANEVAGAAEQMSVNMNTIAAAIEEMSASISQIAGNAGNANKIADEATIKSQNATSVMSELGVAAKEIGQVTDVIKRIADKTNLLALNATIEAASAGESGKGFAVVAGEIKELANQSAKSADDISRRINEIQVETNKAVTVINDVSDIIAKINGAVEAITGLVEEQTKASNEIASNVAQANTGAKRVASAVNEVAKGSNDIARNASDAARYVNQVTGNINTVSQVAHKSSQGASQVDASSNNLAKFADNLRLAMEKFKV